MIDMLTLAVLHTVSGKLSVNPALDNFKTTPTFVYHIEEKCVGYNDISANRFCALF